MLISKQSFRIYQTLVNICISEGNGLTLKKENNASIFENLARRKDEIRKRHTETKRRMDELIKIRATLS